MGYHSGISTMAMRAVAEQYLISIVGLEIS